MSGRPFETAFQEAEAQVFARYSLTPRSRQLRLKKPPITLRAIELGSGEPALFLHGGGVCPAHWASLMSCLPALRMIAIDMPGHGLSGDIDFGGVDLRGWHRDLLTGCLDELGLASCRPARCRFGLAGRRPSSPLPYLPSACHSSRSVWPWSRSFYSGSLPSRSCWSGVADKRSVRKECPN